MEFLALSLILTFRGDDFRHLPSEVYCQQQYTLARAYHGWLKTRHAKETTLKEAYRREIFWQTMTWIKQKEVDAYNRECWIRQVKGMIGERAWCAGQWLSPLPPLD